MNFILLTLSEVALPLSRRGSTKKQGKRWQSRLFRSKNRLILTVRGQLSEDDKVGLMNEIEILMHVDHPNIVRLFEVFEDEETYSLVMELMTGGEVSIGS